MNLNARSLLSVVALAFAAPALAQEQPPVRAYLTGAGGAAINNDFEHPAAAFDVEYGERLHRDVQAYATLGYVENLMSDRMRANLDLAGDELSQLTGVPWQFTGRDRGLVFTMGAKYLLPIDRGFRPYFGGGFGVLNLERHITERDLGDVSDSFYALTGLNDGVMDAGDTSANKPLAELMLGVSGAAGRAYFDVAYKYRKAFHSFEPIAFSQVTVGVGVAF